MARNVKLISASAAAAIPMLAVAATVYRNTNNNVIEYLDWNNALEILDKAYRLGLICFNYWT